MKLLLGIIIFSAAVTGFFFWFTSQNPPESQLQSDTKMGQASSGEIKQNMELGKEYHEIAVGDTKIDVGGMDDHKFSPEVELSRLDGEAKFKVRYSSDTPAVVENNTIRWKDQEKEVYFELNGEKEGKKDSFDFDILLKKRPVSNIFTYNIETTNLDFLYQPPLNLENKDLSRICSETECKDKNGKVMSLRPENVVGSYAVYYKGSKVGDYSKAGGKNYGTGKAFHIYRPQIIDAKGNKIWGALNVDEKTKTLSVTVDPTFLASAAYPVTVDPTFGYTTAGASSIAMNNSIRGSYWSMPENGTPTSISAYIYSFDVCFTGNTQIAMADNSFKQIKDIKLGDKVKSFNEKTKQIEEDTVSQLYSHPKEKMGEYYLKIKTTEGREVGVTPNHRVYREENWVHAGFLSKGDSLLNSEGKKVQILSIEKVYEKVPTYNLGIQKNHVYFANFLVHNAKASFIEGTQVTMADNSLRDIQTIKSGDIVKSFNLTSQKLEDSVVEKIVSLTHDSYLIVTDIYGEKLKVTTNHPLFINGEWQVAGKMKAGDSLWTEFGKVEVALIEEVREENTAFNLIVKDNHNYFANGKLVSDESTLSETGDISEGSQILTANGYKKVEELKVGDKVLSYEPNSYQSSISEVISVRKAIQKESVISINKVLSLSKEASVYTKIGEKKANELKLGDQLISIGGGYEPIFSIGSFPEKDVYAVEISDKHNLYVNGYLIHNTTGYAKMAIYKQSDNTQVTTSAENSFTEGASSTTAWRTFTISSSPELVSSTNYWLYAWGSVGTLSSLNIFYDSGGNGVNKAVAYGVWPDPLTGQTTDSNKYSIYATYTVLATPTPTTYKMGLRGNMNLRGGVNLR